MERRSFFPTVAGLFLGASCADRKPLPARPAPEPKEDFPLSAPTYTDPSVMFSDIRKFVDAHPGAVVLSSDDPISLLLGYSAFASSKAGYDDVSCSFSVPIVYIRGFEGREREMLGTPAGRRALAVDLMKGTA